MQTLLRKSERGSEKITKKLKYTKLRGKRVTENSINTISRKKERCLYIQHVRTHNMLEKKSNTMK